MASRILSAFRETFALEGREVVSTTSIGMMFCDHIDLTALEILRNADIAMYQAKEAGKNRYALFGEEMHERVMQRIELESDLQVAIQREQLRLCYQPIVDLQTGWITSLEALLRWDHPERGRLLPEDFLPIAEESGLVCDIDQWVLEHACQALATWRREAVGFDGLTLTVNLSSMDFTDHKMALIVLDALERAGLTGDSLKLELTESAVLNNTVVIENLFQSLRSSGVQLCMDDFGTGFSSLSYIQRHGFEVLKIDHNIVREMLDIVESRQIVRTIVDMGKILHVSITAEGIENSEQLEALKEMGCPYGQGYFFSKPVDSNRVLALLQRHPQASPTSTASPAPA